MPWHRANRKCEGARDKMEFPAPCGLHRHEHHYVVVTLFDGAPRIDAASGTVTSTLITDGSYFREAGVEHDVCNSDNFGCSFIEVELLEVSPKG